jgi:hypothetical protein
MTLVDLVTLVAGVALGFAAITSLPGWGFIPPFWVLVVIGVSRFFLWMTMAFSVVAMGRVAAYRRMPRAAEWLAIVVSASALATRPEFNVDMWVNAIFATFPGSATRLDFDGWRWVVAGLAGLAGLAVLAVVRLGRDAFPTWLKTLLLASVALLALAGPLWTFGFLGDDLVSPSGGFGGGDLAILHRQLCVLFGHFPTGLFFGLPATAAVLDRVSRRRWAWGEWAGVVSSTLVGLSLGMLNQGGFPRTSPPGMAEWAFILAWLVAIAFTSGFIVRKCSPAWRRWIEGPIDHDLSSSGPESAASTR